MLAQIQRLQALARHHHDQSISTPKTRSSTTLPYLNCPSGYATIISLSLHTGEGWTQKCNAVVSLYAVTYRLQVITLSSGTNKSVKDGGTVDLISVIIYHTKPLFECAACFFTLRTWTAEDTLLLDQIRATASHPRKSQRCGILLQLRYRPLNLWFCQYYPKNLEPEPSRSRLSLGFC